MGTGHGISEQSYSTDADPDRPGQGSGQGTGMAPIIYGTTADVTIAVYRENGMGACFCHPAGVEPPRTDHIIEYVDDATALVNTQGIEQQYGRDGREILQAEAAQAGTSLMSRYALFT